MNYEKNVGVQFQNGANFLIEECAPPELQIPLYMDIRCNVSWTAHHSNWAPCYFGYRPEAVNPSFDLYAQRRRSRQGIQGMKINRGEPNYPYWKKLFSFQEMAVAWLGLGAVCASLGLLEWFNPSQAPFTGRWS